MEADVRDRGQIYPDKSTINYNCFITESWYNKRRSHDWSCLEWLNKLFM